MAYNVLKGNVQFINSDSGSIESMVDDYSNQTIAGIKTFSQAVTASSGLSSSAGIQAESFIGAGTGITGVTAAGATISDDGNNRVLTAKGDTTLQAEQNLKFNGSELQILGNISASVNISGSEFYGKADGLTNIPTNQFVGSISAASLNLGDTLDNDGGELIVDLSSSGGLESTATGLKVNPSVAVQKTSPVNADKFVIADSAASNTTKYITYEHLSTGIASGITTFPPNGSDGNVQIKNGSAFQGPSELTFNTTSNILTVTGKITASVHVSSSQIFATSYFGDGSGLTGLSTNAYGFFTANFTVASDSDLIGIVTTGSVITASLQAANQYEPGQRFTFKDVSGSCSGSNHIVISASNYSSGDRIDGQGIVKIQAGFGAVTIASDGVGSFYIVSTS
tara:strand:- start:3313 stop:4500 length:1188 start_codon:yes stop_codon:yes gene_type:complete